MKPLGCTLFLKSLALCADVGLTHLVNLKYHFCLFVGFVDLG